MLFYISETGNCGEQGCIKYNPHPLGWESNGIGRMLFFLTGQFFIYSVILLAAQSEIFHSIIQRARRALSASKEIEILEHERTCLVQEDNDVAIERSKLANSDIAALCKNNKVIVSELTKCYGNNLAVNRISLGIPKGECFGLLGVNGAGKTSTFKMLTGDETITSGFGFLNGFNVSSQISEVCGFFLNYDYYIFFAVFNLIYVFKFEDFLYKYQVYDHSVK